MAAIDDQFNNWFDGLKGLPQVPVIGSQANQNIQAATDKLKAYWNTLSSTAKTAFLAKLKQHDYPGNPQDLVTLAATLPSSTQTAQQQTTDASAAATSAAQTTANTAPISAATAVGAQLGESTQQTPSYGTPVMGTGATSYQTGAAATGGFNEQLQAYYNQAFGTGIGIGGTQLGSGAGVTDPATLAQLAGTDPATLQAQYQAYVQGITTAKAAAGHGALAVDPQEKQAPVLSLTQFAQQMAQSMVGPWAAVMEAIGLVWQSQTQSTLPPELAHQIITALNGMPSDQKQNVLYLAMQYMANAASSAANKSVRDQTGSLTAAMLSALPSSILGFSGGTGGVGTGTLTSAGIVGTALASAPFLVGEQTTAAIQQAFETKLHRAPTPADLAALGTSPTDIQISQYIDAQPVPGTSMTYGTYSAVSNELTTQWQEYFGRDPTKQELLWAVGKSPTDITSFINNSQSSIPGLTIGRKNDYETFIDSLGTSGASSTTHAFSGALDSSVIADLHKQVTSASTGKATPGAM